MPKDSEKISGEQFLSINPMDRINDFVFKKNVKDLEKDKRTEAEWLSYCFTNGMILTHPKDESNRKNENKTVVITTDNNSKETKE